jgi:hypothetical protein
MSTATDVGPIASTQTNRLYIAGFLDLMHMRSDCTPAGDARASNRYFRSWPLTVTVPGHLCFGTALYDASDSGIAFLAERPVEPTTIVRVKLFWHDDSAPHVPAVVRHLTPHRDQFVVGCEFVSEEYVHEVESLADTEYEHVLN